MHLCCVVVDVLIIWILPIPSLYLFSCAKIKPPTLHLGMDAWTWHIREQFDSTLSKWEMVFPLMLVLSRLKVESRIRTLTLSTHCLRWINYGWKCSNFWNWVKLLKSTTATKLFPLIIFFRWMKKWRKKYVAENICRLNKNILRNYF